VTPGASTRPVVVVGTGGHAHVCAELLLQDRSLELVGCTGPPQSADASTDLPYLGTDDDLPGLFADGISHAFVAVGDNARRKRLQTDLGRVGYTIVNAISRDAVISPSVRLGTGVAVMPGAVVNAGTVVGDGAVLNTGCSVDHDCRVGVAVHVAPRVAVAGWVDIGEGVFLGIGSCVIDKVSIGAWTVVGAGGAVTTDLPAGITAVGVPARPVRAPERMIG
jgi:UDP-perosamine 4-acetyltransferase